MDIKVREYLKKNKIAQKDLAERIGVSPAVLTKKLDKLSSDIIFLDKIATALDTSVLNLIEDDKSKIITNFSTDEGFFQIRKFN
ncbi:helix-turn-helix domain-containing protein [Phocaeicola plebeius]|jgi:transcriptional regulator with XRE-family HTH domain|uniref:helix-turn-helix domain-containing protein n=1 Tax=Phocaeicola plebeius TaxID=310297 RepID=UPI002594D5D6|nr:helix-turn-helix transcriptional regulator [uncultured Bacteroides sp.]